MSVDILLATYNGGRFLEEQLKSLLLQTKDNNIRVLVSDDGSTDNTKELVKKYSQLYDIFLFIDDNITNRGAKGRFLYLLNYVKADYVMFCDQDDIWLPNKVDLMLKSIKSIEEEYSKSLPIMCYSDLIVVDHELKIINNSFWSFEGLNPLSQPFSQTLVQNVATGCTIIANRSLIETSLPIPEAAVMHDWWLLLVAKSFGFAAPVPTATILYRQHDKNVLGAKGKDIKGIYRKLLRFFDNSEVIKRYEEARTQAVAFEKAFPSAPTLHVVEKFIGLRRVNLLTRKLTMLRYRFFGNGFFHMLSWVFRL